MFNSKFINIGALVLMIYCIYEFRSTNYQAAPDEIYPAAQAKYNIDWDIDNSKPNKSMTEKFLGYVFADKIHGIKSAAAAQNSKQIQPVQKQGPIAAIGDEVNLTYTVTQDDKSSKSDSIENFVLHAGDPLTEFLVNMEPNKDKVVMLQKGDVFPKFVEITGETVTMLLSIKSLTKAKN